MHRLKSPLIPLFQRRKTLPPLPKWLGEFKRTLPLFKDTTRDCFAALAMTGRDEKFYVHYRECLKGGAAPSFFSIFPLPFQGEGDKGYRVNINKNMIGK